MGRSGGRPATASGAEHVVGRLAGVFVGRDRERAELRTAVDDAVAARGALLLVTGEPGIGKTRLCWEVTDYAHRVGAQPVWGSCWEGDGAPAYWPWQQVLRRLTVDATTPGADEAQDRPGWTRLLPDLVPSVEAPALDSDPEAARFRLFGEVVEYLASAAAVRPLVLILDDLQWADLSSLLLLQFLAPQLRSLPLVVVGAYRDVEIDDPGPGRDLRRARPQRATRRPARAVRPGVGAFRGHCCGRGNVPHAGRRALSAHRGKPVLRARGGAATARRRCRHRGRCRGRRADHRVGGGRAPAGPAAATGRRPARRRGRDR